MGNANFGDGLTKSTCLLKLTIKYSTQVLCVWSDVGKDVIEVVGNNSGLMWGVKEKDVCLFLIELQEIMSQQDSNVFNRKRNLRCITFPSENICCFTLVV